MTRVAALGAVALLALWSCGSRTPAPADVAANNRGVGLMGRYEYDEAAEIFAALAKRHPRWHEVHVNLAIAVLNRDEGSSTALQILRGVLERDPGNLRAHYCTGLLLFRDGDEEALAHFRMVAEGDRADPYAIYFYGQSLERAGRTGEALECYRQALELDPYHRSACYRMFQLLARAGVSDEAVRYQEQFTRLEHNPRAHTFDYVYTKMGPKAEALALGTPRERPLAPPAAAPFAEPRPLLGPGDAAALPARPVSITPADIDGDSRLDLFVAGGPGVRCAILRNDGSGFTPVAGHELALVSEVNTSLWGDYDNDGRTDVYLCRRGENQLWRQVQPGVYEDMTESTGTGGRALDTVDGAMFDADHDGDLDIFCVNADGPNELLSNNLDGTFRPIAAGQGISGGERSSRRVLVADLDRDRDADLVVINAEPPHEVYANDRLWQYRPEPGFEAFVAAPIAAAASGDLDADGHVEIHAIEGGAGQGWRRTVWTQGSQGVWSAVEIPWQVDRGEARAATPLPRPGGVGLADVDGDGRAEVLIGDAGGVTVWSAEGALRQDLRVPVETAGVCSFATMLLDPARGPSLAMAAAGAAPVICDPDPGRHRFAALAFSGRSDPGQSMRSNASGIGTSAAVRVGSRWTFVDTYPAGAGQGLQPVAVGLGGAERIDFVSIDWSDGVLQSELDLAAGTLHVIVEEQRQISSCPVLFVWDGRRYAFVSDLLGVGGIGYLVAPGEYAPPRPRERFLLPRGMAAPRDGRYMLRLTEPMEEACYLDSVTLDAYDLPPGWSMVLDERMAVGGPQPTGEPVFYRTQEVPRRTLNDRGEDVTAAVAAADGVAAPVGPLDSRFIGRLAREHVLTLEFAAPLDDRGGAAVLVADGWVEYPYSQTMFAAWQAGAAYRAPTVEARGADGSWRVVLEEFGYPAGMPRRMSVALPGLPEGTKALRLRTNQEIYWDRLAVAFAESCQEARRQVLPPSAALLRRCGFPRRTTGPQRHPRYDYDRRAPLDDLRALPGLYTRFGPVGPLLESADDALVIFGAGEEVHLEFRAPDEGPPPGWARHLVLEARGWCKDMDLYTRDGGALRPIPHAGSDTTARDRVHGETATRHVGGR